MLASALLAETPTGSLAHPRWGHTAIRLLNGHVMVVGGIDAKGPVAEAEIYNPQTGRWSDAGALAVPRVNATATLLNDGSVLVVGGGSGDNDVGVETERWTPTTTLSAPATADFGEQLEGTTGAEATVRFTNTGDSPLLVDGVNVDGDYALVAQRCTDAAIKPGATCEVQLHFGPLGAGPRDGALRLRATPPSASTSSLCAERV